LLFSCNKLHYLFALLIVLYIIFKLFITTVVTLQIQIILQYDRMSSSLTTFNLFNQRSMKLSHYYEKKKIKQEAMNKIHQNFPQLKIRENSEYVQWTLNTDDSFLRWWSQISVVENIQNKTQKKIVNSLWFKKVKGDKQFNIWDHFIQLTSIVEELLKISCTICNKIMNHSTAFDSSSTSAMKKHLESDFCTATERKREHLQSQIELTFERVSHIW